MGVYKARFAYRALIVPIYLACASPPPRTARAGFPRTPTTTTILATRRRAESSSPRDRARAGRFRKCGPVRALESPCRAPGLCRLCQENTGSLPRTVVVAACFSSTRRSTDDGERGGLFLFRRGGRRRLSRNDRAIALAPFSTQAQSSVDISPDAHPSRR